MKRLVILSALILVLAAAACAETRVGGGFEYRLTGDGHAEILRYLGREDTVIIPGTLYGHPVTVIGRGAFADCRLTSVTIPAGVTGIGDEAFANCAFLTTVTIPDSVTVIGTKAFDSCIGLTSVTIPDSVTNIGESAFSHCTGMTSVTVPADLTSIADLTFAFCKGLIAVTIPDGVTSIGQYAFYCCDSLTSVTIPDSVTSIGESAFDVFDDYALVPNSSLTLTVTPGSYAEQYCVENGLRYVVADAVFGDDDSWLD